MKKAGAGFGRMTHLRMGKVGLLLLLGCAVLLLASGRRPAAASGGENGKSLRVIYNGYLSGALEPCG